MENIDFNELIKLTNGQICEVIFKWRGEAITEKCKVISISIDTAYVQFCDDYTSKSIAFSDIISINEAKS